MKRFNTDDFHRAMRKSLSELTERGCRITQVAVISNAKFDDGTSVGKTTLYRKNERTGEYVHAVILKEIDAAVATQTRGKSENSRSEAHLKLKEAKALLRKENKALIDQIVSQESALVALQKENYLDTDLNQSLEAEIFVLKSILSRLYPMYKGFVEYVNAYTLKHRGTEQLENLEDRIERVTSDIKCSMILLHSLEK